MISINKKDKFTELWLEHKLLTDYVRPAKEIAQFYHGRKVECTLKRISGLRRIPWAGCFEIPPIYPQGLPSNFRDTTQNVASMATSPSTAASTLGPFCKHCGAQLTEVNNYGNNRNFGYAGGPRGGIYNREANYAIVESHSEPLKDHDLIAQSDTSKKTTTNEPVTNETIQNQCLVLQALTHYRNPPTSCYGDKCYSPFDDPHRTKKDFPDQKTQQDRNPDDEIYALAISNSPDVCGHCLQGEARRVLKSEPKHVHHNNKKPCTNCGVFFNPKERVNQELLVYIEEDEPTEETPQSQTKEVPNTEKEITPEPEVRRSTFKSFWDAFVPTARKKVSNDSLLQIEESVAKETKYSDCIVTTSHCLQLLLDRDSTFSKSSESTSDFDHHSPESKKARKHLNRNLRERSLQRRYKSVNRKKSLAPSNSSFDSIYNYRSRSKRTRHRDNEKEEAPSDEEEIMNKPIRRSSTKPRVSQEKGQRKASWSRKNSELSNDEETPRIKICYGEKPNPFDGMFNKNRKSNSRKYQLLPKRPPKMNNRKSKKSHSDELCACKYMECLCNKKADIDKKSKESKGIEIELCSSDPFINPVTKRDKIREEKRLSKLLERAEYGCTCGNNTPNISKSSISSRASIFIDESKKRVRKREFVRTKSALGAKLESESVQYVAGETRQKRKLNESHTKTKRIIKLFSKGTSTDPVSDVSDKDVLNDSSDGCIYSSFESISVNSFGQSLPISTLLLTESVPDSNSITLLSPPYVSIDDLPEKNLKYNRKSNDFSDGKVFSGSTQMVKGTKTIKKGREYEIKSEKLSKTNIVENPAHQKSTGRKLKQFCANFPDVESCGGLGRTHDFPKAIKNKNKKAGQVMNDSTTGRKKLKIEMCPHGSSMNIIHETVSETTSESNLKHTEQTATKNCCTPLTDQEKLSKRKNFWIYHMRDQNKVKCARGYKNIRNSSDDKMKKKIEFLTKRKHFLRSNSCASSSSVYPTMNILPAGARRSQDFCRKLNLETAIREIDRMSLDNCQGLEDQRVYTCFCKHFAEMTQELVEETLSTSSESINTDDLDRNPQPLESIFPGLMTNMQTRNDVDVVSLLANILGVNHPLVQTPEAVLRKPKGYSIKKDLEQIDEKKKINLQRLEEKVLLDMKNLDLELEKRKALVGTLKQKIVEEKLRLDVEKDRLNRRNSELEKTDPLTGEVTEKPQSEVPAPKNENKKKTSSKSKG
ncbi:uncharacterized protein LOC106674410 [Cimex lectularius]|uniref:Uncharacterized protein n=1 Tax=Cimex lectularius TaxID=79782 RepID=A0A8I6SCF9_CIMLE|nr:uncharacterized protein LOC106674410 [Cimex lectularius]